MKTLLTVGALSLAFLSGCGGGGGGGDVSTPPVAPPALAFSTKEELGQALFFDKNLSRDRNTACATCHNPEQGFVDARFREVGADQNIFVHGALSVGDDGVLLGGRNAPTASYAGFSPTFYKMANEEYKGGQFHDGRAATLKAQAGGPPLDPTEMMMSDKNAVVDRIKENPDYVKAFESFYGTAIFDDISASYESMTEAIAKFEKTEFFAPFDSKYDRLRDCLEAGRGYGTCYEEGNWTTNEEAGYALFFSTQNASCVTCHALDSASEAPLGTKEMFTNYEYQNIGTPRNVEAMNARVALGLQDANAKFDGLAKTVKSSDVNWQDHLGKTKVPTLRNIAVTGPYMNNGVFKKLRTTLEFYDHMGENSTNLHPNNPETNQPWGETDYSGTINHELLAQKSMNDRKIMQLEAFLNTLTDKRYEHLIPELAPEGALGN